MRLRLFVLCTAVLSFCAVMLSVVVLSSSQKSEAPLAMTLAPRYDALAWLDGGERFPDGAKIVIVSGTERRDLVAGFAASADPSVSFDGERILFAGKKSAGDPWQIWEVETKGGEPKQITKSAEDAIRPLYLPEGRRDGLRRPFPW